MTMSPIATLAVELVTEELPPKSLKTLGEAFASALADGLRKREFLSAESQVAGYATPRRLAVVVTHVRGIAPDATVVDKLMPAKVAWDAQGNPSQAYAKKLGGLGRAHLANGSREACDASDRIFVQSDGKADYVYHPLLEKWMYASDVQELRDRVDRLEATNGNGAKSAKKSKKKRDGAGGKKPKKH